LRCPAVALLPAVVALCSAVSARAGAPRSPPMISTSSPSSPTTPLDVDQTDDGTSLNPYHAVVRGKVLAAFRGLSVHDAAPALALMAEDVRYTFEGQHALGGTRVSRRGVERWFGRLFQLLPGPFVIDGVSVDGWPWATRVVTRFRHYVAPPGGEPYWGAGVQLVDLAWGEARYIHTYVDTARLVDTLDALAAQGETEAHADPILE